MKAFKLLVVFLFFVASCGTDNNSSSHSVSKAEDYDLSQTQTSQDGLFEVTYTTTPNPLPLNDYFDMAVTLTEAEVSTDELVLGVDAKMPEHNHGMNVLPEFESKNLTSAGLVIDRASHSRPKKITGSSLTPKKTTPCLMYQGKLPRSMALLVYFK